MPQKILAVSAQWVVKSIWWIFWEFSGIHYLACKLNPKKEENEKPPVAAGIWIIGIYIALFGLASQRYESAVAIIETRIGTVITCLPTVGFKQAIARIPNTQRMLCPVKPELWNPIATVASLLGLKKPYSEGLELLKETIEKWKYMLQEVDLEKADLSNANLIEANLKRVNLFLADLRGANLRGADLGNACLRKAALDSVDLEGAELEEVDLRTATLQAATLGAADLKEACLVGADLTGTHLEGARLKGADLSDACLTNANLSEADLTEADLRGAVIVESQLLTVASLFKTTLDGALLMKVREKSDTLLARIYNDSTAQWFVDTAVLSEIRKPDWKGWHRNEGE
jgi:uncharacterized protein YjbI with pentapeptide repeats